MIKEITLTVSLLIMAMSLASPIQAATGRTIRISVDTAGADSNGQTASRSSISTDGRFVAFESDASDLVPNDGNNVSDVFVRDVVAGITRRVSVDAGGADANNGSSRPTISGSGRFIAFDSMASDLVSGDVNFSRDVFVRDMVLGITRRVSLDVDGSDPNNDSYASDVSDDGRYVSFDSVASDLIVGDGNSLSDVYVRDMTLATTIRVSVDVSGDDANSFSYLPTMTADGQHVAFWSNASDLVPVDGNGSYDVFVRDIAAGTTTRVSVARGGGDANGDTFIASISGNGRFVVFESAASNLVPRDRNGYADIFVRDLVTGKTRRASIPYSGGGTNAVSMDPTISDTGRFVTFESYASNLVLGDGVGVLDVFLRDMVARTTTKVSVDVIGEDANGDSFDPAVSGDGHYVSFESRATDLVSEDGNEASDVFRRLI